MFYNKFILLTFLTVFIKASSDQSNPDLEASDVPQESVQKLNVTQKLISDAAATICGAFESDAGKELLTKKKKLEIVDGQPQETYTTKNEKEALEDFSKFLKVVKNKGKNVLDDHATSSSEFSHQDLQNMALLADNCHDFIEKVEKAFLQEASDMDDKEKSKYVIQFDDTKMTWDQIQTYKNCLLELLAMCIKRLHLDQFLRLNNENAGSVQDTHDASLPFQPKKEDSESIRRKYERLYADCVNYVRWLDSIKLIKTFQWDCDDLNKMIEQLKVTIQLTEEKTV